MSSVLVRLENNPGAGSVYVWNLETNEIQHVPDGYQWGLVGKFLKNITFAEMNQFNFVRQQYANVLGNNVDSIVVPAPTIDLGTVGEQLAATLATYLSEHGVEIDYVKIGEVVDATLADNFNTVNKNIDEQEYVVVPKAAAQ